MVDLWFQPLSKSPTDNAGACALFQRVNQTVTFTRPVANDFTIEFWFRSTQAAGTNTSWRQGMGLVDHFFPMEHPESAYNPCENQLFPEIDLVGNYGRNATGLTFNNNLNTVQRGDYPFYSYGVVMTIPLGNSGPHGAPVGRSSGIGEV
jgi:hypothetical protein